MDEREESRCDPFRYCNPQKRNRIWSDPIIELTQEMRLEMAPLVN